jgi:hypothetical protein
MKTTHRNAPATLAISCGLVLLFAGAANAQWNAPNAYGYSTGYGTVYGSFGLASTMQSMYNVARAKSQATATAKAPATSTRAKNPSTSNSQIVAPPPRVARNHGMFRPDATVDTGKAMADALGDTPEHKALIREIYAATKTGYEDAATTRGWKNNIAGGLTFFTVAAMTVYHAAEEPGEAAVDSHFKTLNASLDDVPDFAAISDKEKQRFNNVMIGFAGILLAGYSEGRQNKDAETMAGYKKLAGMMIEMVLKTDPENLRLENGQIVMK